ncbi:MAG: type II toxin-antitoxin system RelE/ParE family toxin [Chlamydiia bacterium]|nr:type II toxin-antitoxin system RelE/ParE family toxin [Chlamydiia bacterium]MCP5508813.1 type II toxin-antitoxin system RelE/ParE family toxin [Chlamydiales bacterium]
MAIKSFTDKNAMSFFETGKAHRKLGWFSVHNIIRRKLLLLHWSGDLNDLRTPGNHLEMLKGDLKGFYSIRVNRRWRIIFKWDTEPYEVSIVDYH